MIKGVDKTSLGLLRSMIIIGSAKSINIVVLMLRMKAIAVLLGPAGVGVLALYNNFKEVAVQIAGMGIATSGVREVAIAREKPEKLAMTRAVLLYSQLFCGLLAGSLVWLFSSEISFWLFSDASRSIEITLLGLSILLSLVSASQIAIFQGLRQIGDLGRITVHGSILAMLAGIACVWMFGEFGLALLLIFQPVATLAIVFLYRNRLPRFSSISFDINGVLSMFKPMLKVGLAFMLGAAVSAAALLIARTQITTTLGIDAVGYFSAAWSITVMYVGFLLSAMSADYYPRLAEVIDSRDRACALMNDQLQLALALGGPLLLLAIGWAEWIVQLLYSKEFIAAVEILQWQMVANVMKLASWPLSYSLVAGGRAKTFFALELTFNVVFISLFLLLLPSLGLSSVGLAFLVSMSTYLALCSLVTRTLQGFKWDGLSINLVFAYITWTFFLLYLANSAPGFTLLITPIITVLAVLISLRIVLAKVGTKGGRLAKFLVELYARVGWPIR